MPGNLKWSSGNTNQVRCAEGIESKGPAFRDGQQNEASYRGSSVTEGSNVIVSEGSSRCCHSVSRPCERRIPCAKPDPRFADGSTPLPSRNMETISQFLR
jgi:hypothetical protein